MTFDVCMQRGIDSGDISKIRGEEATAIYRDLRDRYRAQGHPDHIADQMAGEDTKAAMRKAVGEERHRGIAFLAWKRQVQKQVDEAKDPARLLTQRVEFWVAGKNKGASFKSQQAALTRLFYKKIDTFLVRHGRNLAGNVRDPATLRNVAREMHGEQTGDQAAGELAEAVKAAFEDARRMFNEAGGSIGKLEDFGIPHAHNAISITRAGFDKWFQDIRGSINWNRMEDRLTGRPMADAGGEPSLESQRLLLREVYDNIAFGKESANPRYGGPVGQSLLASANESRVLHFNDAEAWLSYNEAYGNRDPFGAIVSHLQKMAGDIVTLREFSAQPEVGIDYMAQLVAERARKAGDEKMGQDAAENAVRAKRMFRVATGGVQPSSVNQAMRARFFSTVRHFLSAAMLDRAIISSVSDLNSMRMAAKTIGLNPANLVSNHVELMASSASREELLQMGYIFETLADPGTTMARYQSEVPPAAIGERLSSFVFRAQGLAGWTDAARGAWWKLEAAGLANQANRAMQDLDPTLRSRLEMAGVTSDEWDKFRGDGLFEAANGGKFLPPIWWRENTSLPPREADRIFLKMQAMIDDQMEMAIPTDSTFIRSKIEGDAPAGSVGYEVGKSLTMVKSFIMAFSANQYGRIMSMPDNASRAMYAADLVAGATVMGAVALQLYNLALGREPEDMTDPLFWGRAALKGGGFGVLGDLVSTGETSFGSGFGGWGAGPLANVADDAWDYTFGNLIELASGEETNFGRETVRMLDRYTPGTDLPYIGLAFDRMVLDQLQMILDPEASQDFRAKAARSERNGGAGYFVPPGSTEISVPDFAGMLGR
ncbi:hypothetical protein JANAI62_03660 [Jannaschia pagri]|uniref:Large polyvalent protein associated domain-containing protein n=1 Tax=Jannaschia pagri TaxID=2829797 RepID=A0ABQ4NH34_9RHOB|nr:MULTISPECIES: hypothetical protein [unclassified Jannaschia]GIT90151.1 hypothetical protein JANAI61_06090 [Jannaschia sp. AI_61]GIT93743.1 hypothetical protein JANAI62_03660 [Jannaschia sp. AI_62]